MRAVVFPKRVQVKCVQYDIGVVVVPVTEPCFHFVCPSQLAVRAIKKIGPQRTHTEFPDLPMREVVPGQQSKNAFVCGECVRRMTRAVPKWKCFP